MVPRMRAAITSILQTLRRSVRRILKRRQGAPAIGVG